MKIMIFEQKIYSLSGLAPTLPGSFRSYNREVQNTIRNCFESRGTCKDSSNRAGKNISEKIFFDEKS